MLSTELLYLALYSALLIGLGFFIGTRVRRAAEFFVAGRSLTASLIFATVLAANIGAGSTVGATSVAYREGLSAWWWNGSAAIGSLVLAFWVGPRMWREASQYGFLTVGDFLEHRYGPALRAGIAALLWFGTIFILAAQLIGVGTILQVLTSVPLEWGAAAGGIVTILYFTAGGLLGAAWINVVQLVVLLGGFAVAVPMVIAAAGGWDAIRAVRDIPPSFFDINYVAAPGTGWTRLALFGPAFFLSPGLLQKVFGATGPQAVRSGVAGNAIVLMVFAFAPALLGIAARVLHPDLPNPQLALPAVLAHNLPPAIGGIGLAAIFSAEISTCDAILFMLATSLSQDLYRRFLNPTATDVQVLRVARLAAVAGGTLAILVVIFIARNIVDAMTFFYSVMSVSLLVPIVAALIHAGSRRAVTSAVVAGVVVTVGLRLVAGNAIYGFTPDNYGMAVSLLAFALVAAGERLSIPSASRR